MTDHPSSAVIFCAGFGTRMRHLTEDRPKPLVTFQGRPLVDHATRWLREAGINRLFANTHHMAEMIEPHLGDLGITFHREAGAILDTGGGLKAMAEMLPPGPVVTLNPDVAWRGANPIQTLLATWRPEMHALLLLVPIARTRRALPGDFDLTAGRITRKGPFVYTGAQIIRPEAVTAISDEVFSLNRVWDREIAGGGLHGVVHEGGWHDIGTPEGLAEAERMVEDAES